MPVLLAVAGLVVAILFWVLRAHGTVKGLQEVDRDTKGLQRRAKFALQGIIGTPLQRVRDPQLAATILMIQIVRTGSPVAASEKTQILEFMESPLEVREISAMFERAWAYTEARRPFSLVADPLISLLREALTLNERTEFVAMLTKVAGAHSTPSELQREGIVRLKRRLTAAAPSLAVGRRGDFA